MRQEYLTYAFLSETERQSVDFPRLDADIEEMNLFWQAIRQLRAGRGEQPEEAIYSLPGALRGDLPLSIAQKEIK